MTIAFVANVQVAGPGDITSGAINTTGANFIVISLTEQTSGGYTISDNKSNTWHPLTARTAVAPSQQFFYAYNANVGSGHTFTGTGGAFGCISVEAFSGVLVTDPFDQQTGSGGALVASPYNSETLTAPENNCLYVLGWAQNADRVFSVDSDFTITDQVGTVGGTNFGGMIAYVVQGTAAAVSPTTTWTGGTFSGNVSLVTFKAAPASATREQEGYRWRADDGSETTATWLASQDTDVSRAKLANTRLRLLTNVSGDPPSEQLKLQFRKVGAAGWRDMTP